MSCAGDNVVENSDSVMIGKSFGLNLLRMGSSISCGRSWRLRLIASRISCVASCSPLENTNFVMTVAKPSRASPLIDSTPEIDWIASSIGSRTSRSTCSGDAPGYTIVVTTTGGDTSGNSSVCSFSSETRPNPTSVSMDTTVISGRLMAKSEMNIGDREWCRVKRVRD